MKKTAILFFLILCLPALLLSETIVLKDGRRIETQGTWEENGVIKYFKGGEIAPGIPKERVKRIEKEDQAEDISPDTIGIEEALATDDEKEISIGGPLRNHILHHLRQQVELWGSYEDPIQQTVFQVNRFQPKQTSQK